MVSPPARLDRASTGSMTPPPPLPPSPPTEIKAEPQVKLEPRSSVPGPSSSRNGIKAEHRDHSVKREDDANVKDEVKDEEREEPEVIDVEQIAKAKERHQADLTKHHYEPPQAERPQDDWQVAYVWAFIVKFDQISRIRKLECLEDLEQCLIEPVANRPDDILEGILVRFLGNLKPGLRNLDCTNIQHHLSAYISDALLHDRDFTVWDRPWAPNEQARGSCCNTSPERIELGRLRYTGEPPENRVTKNPIKQVEAKGGGLFELSWGERARLLRQLVDWQLAYSEQIKTIVNKQNKVGEGRGSRKLAAAAAAANAAANAETEELSIELKPLGLDRNKNRIWSLDHSSRLYKSGNPFKRPSPITTISTTRQELQDIIDRYTEHGALDPGKLKGKDGKKATGQEVAAYKKLLKGIEDEKALAKKLQDLVPLTEKEDARIQRARRKIAAAAELAQQAEFRSTRTRRSGRNVNYRYDDMGEEDDESDDYRSNKRSRRDNAPFENGLDHRGRPIIPGERRSTRVAIKEAYKDSSESLSEVDDGDDDGNFEMRSPSPEEALPTASTSRSTLGRQPGSANSNGQYPGSRSVSGVHGAGSVSMSANGSRESDAGRRPRKEKGMKGYAWVEEYVPFHQMSEKERRALLRAQQAQAAAQAVNGTDEAQDTEQGEESGTGLVARPPDDTRPDGEPTRPQPKTATGDLGTNDEDIDRTLAANGEPSKIQIGVKVETGD